MPSRLRRALYEVNVAMRLGDRSRRRQLLRDYGRLQLRLARGETGAGRATLLDWDVEYFDLVTFTFVVEEIFLERIYEVDLPAQPRIIDCGANIGLATLFFAERHPGAHITAYEPGPQTFATLRSNVTRAGCANVELRQEAVSDTAGPVRLYFDTAPGSVGSSLFEDIHDVRGSEEVVAVRLSDEVDEPVDLLKLDVEGAELQVVEDLVATGAIDRVDRIVADYNHHAAGRDELGRMLSLLEQAGFSYQISAPAATPFRPGTPQDIILFAYRRGR